MRSVICATCGARIRADRQHCFRCGHDLKALEGGTWKQWLAKKRRLQLVASGLLSLLLALVLTQSPTARRTLFEASPAISGLFSSDEPRPTPDTPPATGPVTSPGADASSSAPHVELTPARAGSEAFEAGNYNAALAAFQDAVQRNPQDAASLNNLGQTLMRLGRAGDALPYFEQAIALDGTRTVFVFNRATALAALEQWPRAVADYRSVVASEPRNFAAHFNFAQALGHHGDHPAAIEEYQQAIALNAAEPASFLGLGISLEAASRPRDAADAYQRFLELAPQATDASKIRARIARLTGKLPDAPVDGRSSQGSQPS